MFRCIEIVCHRMKHITEAAKVMYRTLGVISAFLVGTEKMSPQIVCLKFNTHFSANRHFQKPQH